MNTKTKQKKGLLVVIVGPSGVGKTVVAEALTEIHSHKIGRVVTTTTRPSRPGESDGVDYHFITAGEFHERDRNQEFYETNKFANMSHFYGTGCADMDSALENNQIVLVIVDINGMRALKRKISNTLVIFLSPGNFKDLERRIKKRTGIDKETIRKRLSTAKKEIEALSSLGSIVVNKEGELQRTIREVEYLIEMRLAETG